MEADRALVLVRVQGVAAVEGDVLDQRGDCVLVRVLVGEFNGHRLAVVRKRDIAKQLAVVSHRGVIVEPDAPRALMSDAQVILGGSADDLHHELAAGEVIAVHIRDQCVFACVKDRRTLGAAVVLIEDHHVVMQVRDHRRVVHAGDVHRHGRDVAHAAVHAAVAIPHGEADGPLVRGRLFPIGVLVGDMPEQLADILGVGIGREVDVEPAFGLVERGIPDGDRAAVLDRVAVAPRVADQAAGGDAEHVLGRFVAVNLHPDPAGVEVVAVHIRDRGVGGGVEQDHAIALKIGDGVITDVGDLWRIVRRLHREGHLIVGAEAVGRVLSVIQGEPDGPVPSGGIPQGGRGVIRDALDQCGDFGCVCIGQGDIEQARALVKLGRTDGFGTAIGHIPAIGSRPRDIPCG